MDGPSDGSDIEGENEGDEAMDIQLDEVEGETRQQRDVRIAQALAERWAKKREERRKKRAAKKGKNTGTLVENKSKSS